MANLDSIFKSRDITLPTKVRLVKAMVFPLFLPDPELRPLGGLTPRALTMGELWVLFLCSVFGGRGRGLRGEVPPGSGVRACGQRVGCLPQGCPAC